MSITGPAPDGELNLGPETTPRQAASVILMRGDAATIEVLLVQRTPKARFMGGVWVFPGGALDPEEVDDPDPHRLAAIRELEEEAAVTVKDPSTLVEFSRWITPAQVKIRFDTRFYLAPLPDGETPEVDGEECVDLGWFTPAGALEAHNAGTIMLVFPTIKHLEQIGHFSSASELLDYARDREVKPIQPRVFFDGEAARVLLPGEPGYENAT
jgi:8-oxo-dGTP pyrophosphatase MutT (NUDIX family)